MGKGIMFNYDSDNFYQTRMDMIDKVDELYLQKFIDQYKNTDVTDFMFCICAQLSSCPSKYKTSYADKFLVKEEMGQVVDYSGTVAEVAYKLWIEKSMDPYKVWIEQCRKININPWISFRMNDAHCMNDLPNFLIPSEFYEHLDDYSIIRHRRQFGYCDRCRDFELEVIRKHWLSYMEEILYRYKPYGLELDFQRELNCFRPGHEVDGLKIMTGFMTEVKKLVKKAETDFGRSIKIAVRCHADPLYNMEWGFDIIEWAKLGLVDVVIPCPRWETVNNDIPVKFWKKILEQYNVMLAVGLEILAAPYPGFQHDGNSFIPNSVESALGSAANILSQGADKVYLFNYFDDCDQMMLEDRRRINDCNDLFIAEGMYKLLTTAGNYEKVINAKRRHIVTYQDKNPLWRSENALLPCTINCHKNPVYIRIATGTIPKGKSCTLRMGISSEGFSINDVDVFVNCIKTKFTTVTKCGEPKLTNSPVYEFFIPSEAIQPDIQIAEILLSENAYVKECTVDYVDITV